MTQGISSSLNLTLARLNSIENNFYALENIMGQRNVVNEETSAENNDFQTILDEKINNFSKEKEINKILENNLSPEIKPLEKESLNLKSKIDLKSQSTDIDELIETFSNKYGIDGDFIKAVIKQESGFNPNATSKKGAMGLMQLMPKTAESLGIIDAYNPSENIEGGVKHLKKLIDKYDNNLELALAAYNAGEGAVKKYGGIPPYKETKNYVENIMSSYNKVKEAKIW